MSKVLATIETHADFEFDIEKRIMKILIRKKRTKFLSGFVLKICLDVFYRNERK